MDGRACAGSTQGRSLSQVSHTSHGPLRDRPGPVVAGKEQLALEVGGGTPQRGGVFVVVFASGVRPVAQQDRPRVLVEHAPRLFGSR